MVFFLVVGIVNALVGVFFAVLAIRSRNPKNLVFTTGEIARKIGYKNYKMRNYTIPDATEYTYTYIVGGKVYRLRGVQYTHSRNVRKRVDIVYLRGCPRCAYEGQCFGATEWVLAACLIAMGAFCIAVSFMIP